MRRRWLRWVLIPLALFALLVVTIRLFVPAEKWKQLALTELEKRTGLEATARQASISFPWPLGLRLGELSVRDPLGRPGYERLEVDVDRVVVRVDLMSVLRRAPRVEEISLLRPRARIWLRSQAPVETAGASVAPAVGGESQAAALRGALALLSIEDARLVIHGPDGRMTRIDGFDQRARLAAEQGRVVGELSGGFAALVMSDAAASTDSVSVPAVEWVADLSGDVDGASGELTLRSLESAGADGRGMASWSRSEDGEASIRLDLEIDLDLARAWSESVEPRIIWPEPLRPGDLEIRRGTLSLQLSVNGPLDGESDADQWIRRIQATGEANDCLVAVFDEAEALRADASLSLQEGSLRLSALRLRCPVGTVQGEIRAPADGKGPLTGELNSRLDAGATRALAQRWWTRLESMIPAPTDGSAPAGPEDWPALSGELDIDVSVSLTLPPPEELPANAVRLQGRVGRLVLLHPDLADSVRVLGGSFRGNLSELDLSEIRVQGPGFEGRMDGQIGGWPERVALEGRIAFGVLDLDVLQKSTASEREHERADGGWFGVDVAWAQPSPVAFPAPPPTLESRLDLSAERLRLRGYELQGLRGTAELADQKLSVSDVQGSLGQGAVELQAEVDWTKDPPVWAGHGAAREISASDLLEPFAGTLAQALETSFSGQLSLDGPLANDPQLVLPALSGLAQVRSQSGVLQTEPILGTNISAFLGRHAHRWQNLDFSSMLADVEIREGRAHFDRFLVEGPTSVRVSGFVGLDGSCDYRLDIQLPPGVTPELGALQPVADAFRDQDGRLSFQVDVSGPAKKPKVQIDLSALEERARSKGEDRLRDLLDQQLDELIPGATPGDSTGAVPSAEDFKEKAEDAVKDLLRGLGSKKKGGG